MQIINSFIKIILEDIKMNVDIERMSHLDDGTFIYYAIKWPKAELRYVYRLSIYHANNIEKAFKKHKSSLKKASQIKKFSQGEPYQIN